MKNNSNNPPNYQISGSQPNYTYKGNQNLNFDSSYISQSGYANEVLLAKGVAEQQKFVNANNNYTPLNGFYQTENNSANLENLRDFSQFNIEENFVKTKPLLNMLNTKYQNDTLYTNLNENLMKESIMEIRLNIDSIDRDVFQYPDPFNYIVTFGPIVNSGIGSSIARTNIKEDLKKIGKKKIPLNTHNIQYEENLIYDDVSATENLIIDYTNKLKIIYNPFITRSFENIKFIRLDNVVLPRFDCLKINSDWDFCKDTNNHNKTYIKDEYERIKNLIILNNRYIPNDNLSCSLFTDRFIQINIKEIESNLNFGTNTISNKSFIVYPDKQVGILYWRGNPFYALKTFKDSLLGNINRLSIRYYNSWGQPITLNTTHISYETTQILNTDIINLHCLQIEKFKDEKNRNWLINKLNEIIKCFIIINFNIKKIIPFYNTEDINPKKYISQNSHSKSNLISFSNSSSSNYSNEDSKENSSNNIDNIDCDYPKYFNIILNKDKYIVKNIYKDLNEFVTINGFITIKKNGFCVDIDEYLNNIIWYDLNKKCVQNIIYNLEAILNNYRLFGFKILDKLKVEIINIPLNPYFQNNLTFVMGQYTNELNTKIDFDT